MHRCLLFVATTLLCKTVSDHPYKFESLQSDTSSWLASLGVPLRFFCCSNDELPQDYLLAFTIYQKILLTELGLDWQLQVFWWR